MKNVSDILIELRDTIDEKEVLYRDILKFFENNGYKIDENVILNGYYFIYQELKNMFALDYSGLNIKNKISQLISFKQICESEIKKIGSSLFEIINSIYPKDYQGIEGSARFKKYEAILVKRLFTLNINSEYDIRDYFGIRFIVPDKNPEMCYKLFEIINTLYPAYSELYKDYISVPNERGYQTLQWIANVPKIKHIEFQIRTEEIEKREGPKHEDYKKLYFKLENINKEFLRKILYYDNKNI